jgi:hypothetical protein
MGGVAAALKNDFICVAEAAHPAGAPPFFYRR